MFDHRNMLEIRYLSKIQQNVLYSIARLHVYLYVFYLGRTIIISSFVMRRWFHFILIIIPHKWSNNGGINACLWVCCVVWNICVHIFKLMTLHKSTHKKSLSVVRLQKWANHFHMIVMKRDYKCVALEKCYGKNYEKKNWN